MKVELTLRYKVYDFEAIYSRSPLWIIQLNAVNQDGDLDWATTYSQDNFSGILTTLLELVEKHHAVRDQDPSSNIRLSGS